ncbi:PREDICTED: pyruvate dehydrogenase protein X component, mitochondrial-like [Amphimedon queenslandica]|uniref:Peripheral subunit-binding (PSBD) domain-containing protein n=1 Tax=Amphimedon queenslandica TaxID=400682 RepID=A0A1X7V6P2_AMPQE|nr:PREDICTED: pyruvate dehydrogenase protein X component, mitochondrial-like [Amphimedon queenslandica]|eukprot:XP_003385613.1 PREDICTED: pyruvate dehydrogenase protein X component, mitochondrial-like [Amphimedon queenslandica]
MAAFRKAFVYKSSGFLQGATEITKRELRSWKIVRTISSTSAKQAAPPVPLSPAVRFLIDANPHLNPADIPSTGPKGRLLKGDVLKYMDDLKSGKAAPTKGPGLPPVESPSGDSGLRYVDIPLNNMRKTIAKRLTASKRDIPYTYAVIDCAVDQLMELRKRILNETGNKVSVNDIIIKAVASTLEQLPESNSMWTPEGDLEKLPNVDVAVAVAIEGGLITPIIRNTNALSIVEISSQIKSLADKARDGKLQPHEYQGGTFCVSNLGMYGISEFTAIINPPQSAILAIGRIHTIPSIGPDETLSGVTKTITATLSCDTRVMDYELSCKWMSLFKKNIEHPFVLGI